jgi:hypothetical protein
VFTWCVASNSRTACPSGTVLPYLVMELTNSALPPVCAFTLTPMVLSEINRFFCETEHRGCGFEHRSGIDLVLPYDAK